MSGRAHTLSSLPRRSFFFFFSLIPRQRPLRVVNLGHFTEDLSSGAMPRAARSKEPASPCLALPCLALALLIRRGWVPSDSSDVLPSQSSTRCSFYFIYCC
ncbi:hypothetical protein LZ31DRAFT_76610 [Colletotrichum somersetense]|nr:hypothetical protein LZ31DRAFT_76610 [Colletotrichum somersetense]